MRWLIATGGSSTTAKATTEKAIADFSETIRLNRISSRPTTTGDLPTSRKATMTGLLPMKTRSLVSHPKHVTAYFNRGNAYRCKGDWDRALADYNEAIRLSQTMRRPTTTLPGC